MIISSVGTSLLYFLIIFFSLHVLFIFVLFMNMRYLNFIYVSAVDLFSDLFIYESNLSIELLSSSDYTSDVFILHVVNYIIFSVFGGKEFLYLYVYRWSNHKLITIEIQEGWFVKSI